MHHTQQVKEANKYFAIDSGIALAVSFVINLAVVSSFAYHFFECVRSFVGRSDAMLHSSGTDDDRKALHRTQTYTPPPEKNNNQKHSAAYTHLHPPTPNK